jgi:hypothetical protein
MGGLLDELSKRLADRWLPQLVLPGALYLAVAIAARTLGQHSPFDFPRLITQVSAWAKSPAVSTVGGQVVVLLAALAAAAAIGVTAQVLGSLAERFVLAAGWERWVPPFRQMAGARVTRRRDRWDAAHARYSHHYGLALRGSDPDPAARQAAYRERSGIALERPGRPTWSGDRVNAAAVRIQRDLHLDLPTAWPDTARAEITAARQALASATTLMAWAVLYAVLIRWWWPAALIAAALAVTGWHRTRTGAAGYAALLEASTRLHLRDLASQLGLSPPPSPGQQTGERITAALHSAPPLASVPDRLTSGS